MSAVERVSVIVPTRALPERAAGLWRAIESVLSQRGVDAIPIVVINGGDRDPAVGRELAARDDLRVVCRQEANLPAALLAGRQAVDTPWFGELDDDDELLPDALAYRVEILKQAPQFQVVVTNGIRRSRDGDRLQVDDPSPIERDPLRALLARHWLMPGTYLCRSDAVGPELFAGMPSYLENTFLAVRFAMAYRFFFADRPTVVRHLDTPHSESKSRQFLMGQVGAVRQILELGLPTDVDGQFRRRIAAASHTVSVQALSEGNLREAWRWHNRSLRERGGWRYFPYAWRLIQGAWRR